MFLLHGSDGSVSSGLPLLRLALHKLVETLPQVLSAQAPDRDRENDKGRTVDRNLCQQIMYSMKQDPQGFCHQAATVLMHQSEERNYHVVQRLSSTVFSQEGIRKLETALENHGVDRKLALTLYKDARAVLVLVTW